MVCLQKEQYFSVKQYLLGDSAFNNSTVMVSSYKKTAGSVCLPTGQQWFNDLLLKPQSGAENVIGIWKGCFPYIRSIHVRLKNQGAMKRIIRYILATVVLHNLFIKHGIDEDWILLEDGEDNDIAGDAEETNDNDDDNCMKHT